MKIVLAYSGGLDTSVLVRWLKDHYNAEIITFAADVGQEEELDGLEEKAKATGRPMSGMYSRPGLFGLLIQEVTRPKASNPVMI